jgi:hypothetical protein
LTRASKVVALKSVGRVLVVASALAFRVTPRVNDEVASIRLACTSATVGVRCRVLALFQDVSRPPSDVTATVAWRLSGVTGANVSPIGDVRASADGVLHLEAAFRHADTHMYILLKTDHPGQVLGVLRGHVYRDVGGRMQPVAHAAVEVLNGASTSASATTSGDGSYELIGIQPGTVVVRSSAIGCRGAVTSIKVHAGENHLSVLLDELPVTSTSEL